MSGSVDIGTLQGTLAVRNAYSAEFDKFDREVKEKLVGNIKHFSAQTKAETTRIQNAFERVAASLDPAIANSRKYQQAQQALSAALKSGIITQEKYNQLLSLAREKHLGVNASTLTWREEIQKLTGALPILGGKIDGLIGSVGGFRAALTALTSSESAAAGGAVSLSAALAPLALVLGAVVVAAGAAYIGFEALSFLSTVTQEGVQTQLVIEKLNNTLASTGSYAQLSSAQLVALAESYELLSGKSKEEIIAAETILARFESLNNKTYPDALRVTLAYSKAMGISADAAASKLGPALEGNTRALGSLKEAGIVLSKEQRKTLEDLIDTGNAAEYQAKLLEILKEKVGTLSSEYDKNLSRQADRAKIVLQDFGESIANEVIPAIEDVVKELITSLGGWDALKKKVNEVGGAIGNFIRTSIYGLAIGFNEIVIVLKTTVIPAFQKYIEIIVATGKTVSLLTLNKTAFDSYTKLGKSVAGLSTDYSGNQAAITRLTKGLVEHRVALEGNNEVYKNNGTVIDSITGKNRELAGSMDELDKIYSDQTLELQRIFDLRKLASGGPASLGREERLAKEKEINEAYKERIIYLQQEEKFGEAVAKSLAEQRKQLKDFELKAKIELAVATKLEPIKINLNQIFKLSDKPFSDSMRALDDIVANENKNREEFQKTFDEYNSLISQTAANWVEHFKSMRDIADEEMSYVKQAVKDGLLSVAEGERAVAEIRANYYSTQVDQWTGFASNIAGQLSKIGGSFGKFMAQVASVAQGVQNVNSTANSLGGWSSMAGAWGGVLAAYAAVYSYADSMIEKSKSLKYGTTASLGVTGGLEGTSYIKQEGLALSRTISEVLKSLADSLRISVDDLASVEIKIRNNGKEFQAWVKGEWIGTFTDLNTAIREALLTSMMDPDSSLRGMSDLMAQGMSKWTSPDVEGLLEFLTSLREISDLSLSPLVIELQKSTLKFNEMREVLAKLDQSNEAVIKAQKELTEAQNYLFSQTKAQLLGIDMSAADAIRNLAGFQKGMDSVSESASKGIEDLINSAQHRLDILEGKIKTQSPTGGEGTGGVGGAGVAGGGKGAGPSQILIVEKLASETVGLIDDAVEAEKERLRAAIEDYKKQLGEVPKALSLDELNLGIFTAFESDMRKSGKYAEEITKFERMRVSLRYEEIRLQLIGIGLWEQWAGIWQDLYNQALASAGKGIGKSGGSSDKDSIRDFIKDKKFDLSLSGLSEYQKSLKELDHQYDDLIKQAGKDNKLKSELLALKAQEIALLEKEKRQKTVESFTEFINPANQFDKVRKTAAGLIKEINDSPFGDARKARMISQVMGELNKQLETLAKQSAISLFGSMISDMERFGATDEEMRTLRMNLAIFEHELKMAQYQREIGILEAEGKLAQGVIDSLKIGLNFLSGIDPTKFIGNFANDNSGTGSGMDLSYSATGSYSGYEDYTDLLAKIREQLAEWNRIPLGESLSRAHEITDSFNALLADIEKLKEINALNPEIIALSAQAQESYKNLVKGFIDETLEEFEDSAEGLEGDLGDIRDKFTDINEAFRYLGATQEDLQRAELARLSAVNKALDQYLNPIRERLSSRSVGERSILSGEQQYYESQRQFRSLFSEIQSGDLSHLSDAVRLADQYEELTRSFTGGEGLRFGLKEIDDTLLAITNLVPEFANEMSAVGSETNPMHMDTTSLVNVMNDNLGAVNTGNALLLTESRATVVELRSQSDKLESIESLLSNPISVRDVA